MHSSFLGPSPHLPLTALRPPLPLENSLEFTQPVKETNQQDVHREDKRAEEEAVAQHWYLLAVARRLLDGRQQRIWVNFWAPAGAPGVEATAARLSRAVWAWRVRAGMSHPPAMCVRPLRWQAVSQQTHKHQSGVSIGPWPRGADRRCCYSHRWTYVYRKTIAQKHLKLMTKIGTRLQSGTCVHPRKLVHEVPSGGQEKNINFSSTAARIVNNLLHSGRSLIS